RRGGEEDFFSPSFQGGVAPKVTGWFLERKAFQFWRRERENSPVFSAEFRRRLTCPRQVKRSGRSQENPIGSNPSERSAETKAPSTGEGVRKFLAEREGKLARLFGRVSAEANLSSTS